MTTDTTDNNRLTVTIFGQNIGTADGWDQYNDHVYGATMFYDFIPNETGLDMFEGQLEKYKENLFHIHYDLALNPWNGKYEVHVEENGEDEPCTVIDLILKCRWG